MTFPNPKFTSRQTACGSDDLTVECHAATDELSSTKWRSPEESANSLNSHFSVNRTLRFEGKESLVLLLLRRPQGNPTPRDIMPEVSKMRKPDVKVVLLGDMNVGKTSLLHRYTERKFKDTVSTVGGAFYLKQWGPYNISIWDTAGNIDLLPLFFYVSQFEFICASCCVY